MKKILGILLLLFSWMTSSCLKAADTTNAPASFQEKWASISNRWGSVSPEQIKQIAEKGDVTAQYYLGCSYDDGTAGLEKNPGEAFKWMNLAAQQGMARAQRKLGDMYYDGSGVLQDYVEAAKFYRLAAEQGNAIAQSDLGWVYKKGQGVPQDAAEALKWYEKSANQGEPMGVENLAWMYAQGAHGPKAISDYGPGSQVRSGGFAPDHDLAEKWMRQAVDLNTAEGQYKMGNLIFNEMDKEGQQDTTRFFDAAGWFKKAAEQGNAKAQYELADMYNTGKLGDDQRSNCIPWYLKAAAQGDIEAKARVGELPALYPGNELLKTVDNIRMLRQSGDEGNLEAQYQLAKRYQFGIGVTKDPREAFKWMQKAAQNDTASSRIGTAIYDLALMYEKGEGVTSNLDEAHKLFLTAAGPDFCQQDAAFRAGQMYENGDGVPQDDQKAGGFYANKTIFSPDNDKYPNGFISYHGVTAGGVESLLRLWSQGRGLPSDQDKALPGYKEPGAQVRYWGNSLGTVGAHYFTGVIYCQGKLVSQDLVEAAARFHLAANQHWPEAQKALDEVESKMSPEQKVAEKGRLETLEKNFEMIKSTAEANQKGKDYMPW